MSKFNLYGSSHAAFIFDNDGTLVDTESVWFEAYNRFLSVYGEKHDLATHSTMMGRSTSDCIKLLQQVHTAMPQGEEVLQDFLAERIRLFRLVRNEMGIRPMLGVEKFLLQCQARGIQLAIATGSNREDIETQLAILKWRGIFQAVVTADDVNNHKPAPDIYLEAASRLSVEPASCVAFEDGRAGTASALAAGMPVVFIHDKRFNVPIPTGIALAVESFEELTSLTES